MQAVDYARFLHRKKRRPEGIFHCADSVKKRLAKSRREWVFGVAGGLAEYLGISPKLVRMAFVVGAAFSTLGCSPTLYCSSGCPKRPKDSRRCCPHPINNV